MGHPWVLHFSLTLPKLPGSDPGLAWDGILLSRSQSAVPHPPTRALLFGDKVPFKILGLFPFLSPGWVFEGF